MNKNRKIFGVFLFVFMITISTFCLATSQDMNDSENVKYIDNYEDYQQLMNDTQSGYSQEELKKYYAEYQDYIKGYYEDYHREKTVKAKVVEVKETEEKYEFDEYYYSVSKYEVQPVVVEALEGEYTGQRFELSYLLTGDSLNNIRYSELKKGDTIFVSIHVDETTGKPYADITNTGSNIERFGIVVCIAIITVALLVIYGGKKGVLASLIAVLILDFCLVIIPNMGFAGQGFVIGSAILILLLISTISIMEHGITKKALSAIGISTVVTLAGVLLTLIGNYLTRTVGITFEVAAISENVLLGNMDFETLYICITMMIAAGFITKIVCKSIREVEKENATSFNERLTVCRNVLGSNVLLAVLTLFALYIPNHLLLLTNKYTQIEIWNAEILTSELIRAFVVIITMTLAVPTVAAAYKKEEKDEKI